MSNRELLQSIHRANVSALPWQHVSLRAVQNELQLHGLLDSLFTFQPWRPLVHSDLWTLRDPEEFDARIQVMYTIYLLSTPATQTASVSLQYRISRSRDWNFNQVGLPV